MKLQNKISLLVLPFIAAAIVFFGLWTIRSSDSFFVNFMLEVIAKDLEVYVGTTLQDIVNDVKAGQDGQLLLDGQQQAFFEAKKEHTLETGHIFIISPNGELVFCSRGHDHLLSRSIWLPVAKVLVANQAVKQGAHIHDFSSINRLDSHHTALGRLGAALPVSRMVAKGDMRILEGHAHMNDQDVLYAAAYFKPWDWVVVLTISDQEVHSAIAGQQRATLLVSAVTILVTFVLLSLFMRRFFVKPVAALQEAAWAITGHQYVERVAVDSDDELGSLARSMEVLSATQRQHDEEQARWQVELEQKVAARTRELQSMNDTLNNEISQRKKAHKQAERLLYTLDHTLDSVFMFRPDTLRFFYLNNGAIKQLGYSEAELLSMTPLDIKPEVTDTQFREILAPLISGEKEFINFETVHQHKDGHHIPVEIFLQYVAQEENESLCIAIVRDISARKKAESEKEELEHKLRQAHKMEAVGTLAGGIAHDFNNILAAIIGFSELAQVQLEKGNPVWKDIDQVLMAGRRAKELVKQILAFSRQSDDEKINVQPRHIVRDTIRILRATVPSSVEIRTAITDQCPHIQADPTQIHQVLLNLCVNGVHAMSEKGRLTIGLREVVLKKYEVSHQSGVEPGRFICLSVTDTGAGISDSVIKRIFDPFFTTKGVGEGTGMGLAMVHGIVEDHGGMIKVESSLGHGTTFRVFLPVAEDEEDGQVSEPPSDTTEGGAGFGHLLIVDDEEPILNMYKRSLGKMGYTVTTAPNGQYALDLFRAQPSDFDMLITDQTMPRMTGTELTKEVLAIRPDLPVILCSGYSSSIDTDHIDELGVRRYLNKPIDLKMLAKEVGEILGD